MKSYKAIEAEIEKLKKQAATVRKAELKSVITAIRKQIAQYDLTAEELGFGAAANSVGVKARRASASPAVTVGVPKYRDPVTQKTWTGRGKPPLWIVGVKNRDDFLIDRVPVAPKAAVPVEKASAPKSRAAAGKKAGAASPKAASPKPVASKKRASSAPRKSSAAKPAPEAV